MAIERMIDWVATTHTAQARQQQKLPSKVGVKVSAGTKHISHLIQQSPIKVRNPRATRPWQHVLEPLGGYLCLAEALASNANQESGCNSLCSAFNFGPEKEANRSVEELIEESLKHWHGSWSDYTDPRAPHEAGKLNLQIDKAKHILEWEPRWNFAETIKRTILWYKTVEADKAKPLENCLKDIHEFNR